MANAVRRVEGVAGVVSAAYAEGGRIAGVGSTVIGLRELSGPPPLTIVRGRLPASDD